MARDVERKRKRTAKSQIKVIDLTGDDAAPTDSSLIRGDDGHAQEPPSKIAKITTQPFRLRELPAELRNVIYEIVLEDSSVTLRRSPKVRKSVKGKRLQPEWQDSIDISCPLAQTNRQVRSEVYYIAMISANIRTLVVNFDFGHAITFLNRLSDVELNKMSAEDGNEVEGPQRLFTITLKHTEDCLTSIKPLRRWLNRMIVTEKKGTNIDYRYTFVSGIQCGSQRWMYGLPWGPRGVREHVVWVVGSALSGHGDGSRASAEATKIKSAVKYALR